MKESRRPLKIISVSDIHYLSPKLNDKGCLFKKTMNTADGKHTLFIEEILDAFLDEVRKEKPDYVLISGDLTFNGEKASHEDLAEKLKELKKDGIQTLVIPGNHDVNFPFSYSYKAQSFQPCENVDADEFVKIYEDLGYKEALSRDEHSLSYVYELDDYTWLFGLDANANQTKGAISQETLAWAEEWMKKAKEQGKIILTMTHQHILSHNLLTSPGYLLFNADQVYSLLNKYGAILNFSGHMHIQHVKMLNHLATISSGSLSIYPNLYGVMEMDEGRLDYQTKKTDVQSWAIKNGIQNHRLRGFERESKAYFCSVWGWQINQELEDFHVPPMERVGLVEFCVQVLYSYLAGETWLHRTEYLEDPIYQQWKEKAPGSYFQAYLESILEDPSNSVSDTELHLDLQHPCKYVPALPASSDKTAYKILK